MTFLAITKREIIWEVIKYFISRNIIIKTKKLSKGEAKNEILWVFGENKYVWSKENRSN